MIISAPELSANKPDKPADEVDALLPNAATKDAWTGDIVHDLQGSTLSAGLQHE
jgi:hypothetical protein